MATKSLGISVPEASRAAMRAALEGAFRPFGSLEVEGDLAGAMMAWAESPIADLPRLAAQVLSLLWSAETDQVAGVQFSRWEVTVVTPTSGTRISLRRFAGGMAVRVDFGPRGSHSRAAGIRRAWEGSLLLDEYDIVEK